MRIGTCARCKHMDQWINFCTWLRGVVREHSELCQDCFERTQGPPPHVPFAGNGFHTNKGDVLPSFDNVIRAMEDNNAEPT